MAIAGAILSWTFGPATSSAQGTDPAMAGERPTLRAHRIEQPIRVDGRLDEAVWREAPSYAGFIQKEPVEAAPAINDSEVWVLYDDEAVYIGGRLYDEAPGTIAANMVRSPEPTTLSRS